MESQSQNPEFRINPENFHPCIGTANISEAGNTEAALQVSVDHMPPITY